MVIRCSSCNTHDFQHRYASMIDALGRPGQLCATCFNEWLGVDRSHEKAKFEEMKSNNKNTLKSTTNKLVGGKL